METSILVATMIAILLPMMLSGKEWKVAEERARKRRTAEHRLNARLLRLNLD